MSKEPKKRVTLKCSDCGNKLTASLGMAEYALEGKGVCVKCGGRFVRTEVDLSGWGGDSGTHMAGDVMGANFESSI